MNVFLDHNTPSNSSSVAQRIPSVVASQSDELTCVRYITSGHGSGEHRDELHKLTHGVNRVEVIIPTLLSGVTTEQLISPITNENCDRCAARLGP